MKERLTGAIILVALLVLLVPELLTGPSSAPAVKPAAAEGPPLRSYTIDLQDDAANRQPPSAPSLGTAAEPVEQKGLEDQAAPPPVADVAPPVDEATRATGKPMGSGADPSAAAPAAQAEAGRAAAAPPAGAEGDRPRSAFGPNAVSRTPPEKPAAAPKPAAKPPAPKAEAPKAEVAKAAAPKAEATKVDASKVDRSKGWAVQLGVFASRDNADRLAKEVKGSGYPVLISEMSGNGRKLYRVRVGPEAERDAAVALGAKLRAAGHAGTVVPYP